VAEILTPGLNSSGVLQTRWAQLRKGAEAVRIEIGEFNAPERLRNLSRIGCAVLQHGARGRPLECSTRANSDFSLREKRVGLSPKQRTSKIFDPLGDDPRRFVADGEEPGREALAALGCHLPRPKTHLKEGVKLFIAWYPRVFRCLRRRHRQHNGQVLARP
jgi:hypothetical protein